MLKQTVIVDPEPLQWLRTDPTIILPLVSPRFVPPRSRSAQRICSDPFSTIFHTPIISTSDALSSPNCYSHPPRRVSGEPKDAGFAETYPKIVQIGAYLTGGRGEGSSLILPHVEMLSLKSQRITKILPYAVKRWYRLQRDVIGCHKMLYAATKSQLYDRYWSPEQPI